MGLLLSVFPVDVLSENSNILWHIWMCFYMEFARCVSFLFCGQINFYKSFLRQNMLYKRFTVKVCNDKNIYFSLFDHGSFTHTNSIYLFPTYLQTLNSWKSKFNILSISIPNNITESVNFIIWLFIFTPQSASDFLRLFIVIVLNLLGFIIISFSLENMKNKGSGNSNSYRLIKEY